jgi:hypothetical protein
LKVYLQCDNDKEVQARKLRPPLAGGEKDLLIDYFAEICRVEPEKRILEREYKCGLMLRPSFALDCHYTLHIAIAEFLYLLISEHRRSERLGPNIGRQGQ